MALAIASVNRMVRLEASFSLLLFGSSVVVEVVLVEPAMVVGTVVMVGVLGRVVLVAVHRYIGAD